MKADVNKSGIISCPKFTRILHNKGCFVSREELLNLYNKFGNMPQNSDINFIDMDHIFYDETCIINYKKMSQEMNLHQ